MRASIGCVAVLLGSMGMVTDAAAVSESIADAAGKRGLSPIIYICRSSLQAAASVKKELTIGVCQPVPNVFGVEINGEHAINPIPDAINYLWSFDEYFKQLPEEQRRAALSALESTGKATILQQPKYGTLTDTAKPDYPVASPNRYFYNPKPSYMGKDQVVFLVEMGEYKIKVINNIYPVAGATGQETTDRVCGSRGTYYRISSAREQLSSLLSGTNYSSLLSVNSGVVLNFASLPRP